MKKRVIVSVINDLVTDQRVHKVCETLVSMGFDVLLVGRVLKKSPQMDSRTYRTKRMKLLFEKGPLFYAEFNIRLFFLLLFRKTNLLVSNDLDTLLPNYLISKIKRIPLVYDSHEYFTEVPELVNRKAVQLVWKKLEALIFPKLVDVITVNDSIAGLYEKDYGKRPVVVRNIPRKIKSKTIADKQNLGLPYDKKIVILQGSGINVDRGSEELIEAWPDVKNALLLIVGGGDVIDVIKKRVEELKITDRVIFLPRLPYNKMMEYTMCADLGLTIDKPTNLNYLYSLPNKLFDYIQANVPVLSSNLPEIKKIITHYEIGGFIEDHNPENISKAINHILSNQSLMDKWKKNCSFAASELTWENEEISLKNIYSKYA